MSKKETVKDKWILLIIYPMIGVSFVLVGNDNTFKELLQIPSYYTDNLLSLTLLYIVGFYIRWISGRFENRFDWVSQFKPRITHQLIWGLVIPAAFIVFAEMLYLAQLDIPLSDSSIFYLELPLTIVILVLINLTYIFLYYRQYSLTLKTQLFEHEKAYEFTKDKYFLAKQGNQNIQVPYRSIAYFILKNKLTFLVTTDNHHLLFDKSMKEVLEMLPKHEFYRLNRQLIAKRSSILKCSPTKTRRLKIELNPAPEEDVFLPKVNVSPFMRWFNES